MIPPLTTVQMSQKELAQIAFRALLNEVGRESPSTQKSEYELNTNLILRRSTAMALPSSLRGPSNQAPKEPLVQTSEGEAL